MRPQATTNVRLIRAPRPRPEIDPTPFHHRDALARHIAAWRAPVLRDGELEAHAEVYLALPREERELFPFYAWLSGRIAAAEVARQWVRR